MITIQSIAFLKEQQNHWRTGSATELLRHDFFLLRIPKHSVVLLNNSVGLHLQHPGFHSSRDCSVPQPHEPGATCLQKISLFNECKKNNEMSWCSSSWCSVLFFFLQEMGSGCKGFKCAVLFWSILESGEEWILWQKEDNSELAI